MKNLLKAMIVIIPIVAIPVCGQTVYSGFIGKAAVEFVVGEINWDSQEVEGVYMYKKYNDPIPLKGRYKKSRLVLDEMDGTGKKYAIISFEDFNQKKSEVNGSWKDLTTKTELAARLNRVYDFTYYTKNKHEWVDRELLQKASLKNYYFRIAVSNNKDGFAKANKIKLIEKKTGKIFQEINVDCAYRWMRSIDVGDFNFDGKTDFSIFERSYAGSNTSSLYFLFDPETNKYINSGFVGTSLEFDANLKRVVEKNQDGPGGSVYTENVYKIVNNKMVLLEKHCWENSVVVHCE
jgi:hypothetical protein